MVARSKIGRFYVERYADGRFKKWTSIGKSIAADKRKKSRFHPKKPGYGNIGDYR